MFAKLLFSAMLLISIGVFSFNELSAQKVDNNAIIVSEPGEQIDPEGRNRYKLFNGIQGIKSPVLPDFPDVSYVSEATCSVEETNTEGVRQLSITEWTSIQYGIRIGTLEKIPVGTEKKNGKFLYYQDSKRDNIPPLNTNRIAGEVILGSIGGFVGGTIIWAIWNSDVNTVEGEYYLHIIGSICGSTLPVFMIGSLGNEKGSLGKTFLGSVIGSLALWVILFKTDAWLWEVHSWGLPLVMGGHFVQSGLATYMFNKTRKWDTNVATGALLRLERDSWRADLVSLLPRPEFTYRYELGLTFNIARIAF